MKKILLMVSLSMATTVYAQTRSVVTCSEGAEIKETKIDAPWGFPGFTYKYHLEVKDPVHQRELVRKFNLAPESGPSTNGSGVYYTRNGALVIEHLGRSAPPADGFPAEHVKGRHFSFTRYRDRSFFFAVEGNNINAKFIAGGGDVIHGIAQCRKTAAFEEAHREIAHARAQAPLEKFRVGERLTCDSGTLTTRGFFGDLRETPITGSTLGSCQLRLLNGGSTGGEGPQQGGIRPAAIGADCGFAFLAAGVTADVNFRFINYSLSDRPEELDFTGGDFKATINGRSISTGTIRVTHSGARPTIATFPKEPQFFELPEDSRVERTISAKPDSTLFLPFSFGIKEGRNFSVADLTGNRNAVALKLQCRRL